MSVGFCEKCRWGSVKSVGGKGGIIQTLGVTYRHFKVKGNVSISVSVPGLFGRSGFESPAPN